MTDRESFVAAIAAQPGEDAARLIFADWLDEHGEPDRAGFVRAACAAARARSGSRRRADLLDRAEELLARHEADWLGEWRGRLIDWEFRRGFLHRVRLTANTFLRHAAALFRAEPVGRVELVDDAGEPLAEDAIRAVVSHPAFGWVRDCAVVPRGFLRHTLVYVWLGALAANPHVTRLRRFGPMIGTFQYDVRPQVRSDGIDEASFAAFCQAEHLQSLRGLILSVASGETSRPWLIPYLAAAPFARRLTSLALVGCGLPAEGARRLATDPVFGALERLRLSWRGRDRDTWAVLFNSTTLTAVKSIEVGADLLPAYARSPMAARVRDLTVTCANDLDRNLDPDRQAWLELIDRAPPPRRLVLRCHNPGPEVFAAMRRKNWLRDVRELSISGDSQYEVYSGRTEGIRSLFGPRALRRLASLKLHEACDRSTLATLARWRGAGRLESLELTDDYHGRLVPSRFEPAHAPQRLRNLCGVVLFTDKDVERFLTSFPLERLTRLKLSFCAEYGGSGETFLPQLSPAAVARLLRSDRLARLTELTLGFHYMTDAEAQAAQTLADPSVMPRLLRLQFYGNYGNERPSFDELRARFGLRLRAE
jgi:uncharacterized protein (TIGR02996 family)